MPNSDFINLLENDTLISISDLEPLLNSQQATRNGFRNGIKLKTILAQAVARRLMNASIISTFLLLFMQLCNPARYNDSNCLATENSWYQDQFVQDYLGGMLAAFILPDITSGFANWLSEGATERLFPPTERYLLQSEFIDAAGCGIYIKMATFSTPIPQPLEYLLYVLSSYPLFCFFMKKMNRNFSRGAYSTYRKQIFQDKSWPSFLKLLSATFFESTSNGIDLASCLCTLAGLIINFTYKPFYEGDYKYANLINVVASILGVFIGFGVMAKQPLLDIMNKLATIIDVLYITLIPALHLQACHDPQSLTTSYASTGYKYVIGLSGFSTVVAALHTYYLDQNPYDLAQLDPQKLQAAIKHDNWPKLARVLQFLAPRAILVPSSIATRFNGAPRELSNF